MGEERNPWSSMAQPGSPQPEHLDEASSSRDASSQPDFISLQSLVAIKAACLTCLLARNNSEGGGGVGQFYRTIKSKWKFLVLLGDNMKT